MASRLISQLKSSRLIINTQLAFKLNARSFHLASADQGTAFISTYMNLLMKYTRKTKLNLVPVELKMPALSPTMAEGTIIKWLKIEVKTDFL